MDNDFYCPLLEQAVSVALCHDVQMVLGGMIKKRVLEDYNDPPVDMSKVTAEGSKKHCTNCIFTQLSG